MPLSRVEERRWFSRVLLTRLPHISLYPHSLHVRPSRHISTLHPLNIHLHRLLFLTFHLLPLPSPLPSLPCWSPPLYLLFSPFSIFSQSLFARVHIHHLHPPLAPSIYCTPTSLLPLLLYFPDVFTPLENFPRLTLSSAVVSKRHSHC